MFPGRFLLSWGMSRTSRRDTRTSDNIQALAEIGVAGLAIRFFDFVAFWRTAYRTLMRAEGLLARGIGLATLGAPPVAALQEVTEFALFIPHIAGCFAVPPDPSLRAARLFREAVEEAGDSETS